MCSQYATIGVFTSSYPITAIAPEATQRAISYLERNGYRVKCGSLTGKREQYRSGNILQRAQEFNELLYDPEVSILMATVGGMVSNAILPYIDYDYLSTHPKLIVGHSDITALLLGIYQRTGLTTYYGPNLVTTFGQPEPLLADSLSCFSAVFSHAQLPYTYQKPNIYCDELTDWSRPIPARHTRANSWRTIQNGAATGRLIGGNLNTISGIMGTPYMPEIREGDILFLEDTEKFAAHAERYFSLLKLSGILNKVGGIILGKHRQFDDQETGKAPVDILLEVMGSRNIPILADVDCCHTVPMLTLPIGGTVHLDASRQQITLLQV